MQTLKTTSPAQLAHAADIDNLAKINKCSILYFQPAGPGNASSVFQENCKIPTDTELSQSWLDKRVNSNIRVVTYFVELFDILKHIHTAINDSTHILVVADLAYFNTSTITLNEFCSMIDTYNKCTSHTKKVHFVVVVDDTIARSLVTELRRNGILGIIPSVTEFSKTDSAAAIEQLVLGQEHWPRVAIKSIIQPPKVSTDDGSIKLTRRQAEIYDLVCARGVSNKKIAQMLKISESTVKVHVSAILHAYRVKSRTQLVIFSKAAASTGV